MSDIPRRCDVQRWSEQEYAIGEAIHLVELLPADVRLTDAVVLLQAARASVADYLDNVESRRDVYEPNEVARIKAERDDARYHLGQVHGVLTATVARLGGIIETSPTGRHTFLPRSGEHVEQEAKR